MSTVRPEPLALEVALAHYIASLPEGKSVALEELAGELGCSVDDLRRALESVIEVEDRDLTTISGVLIEDGRLVKYLHGGYGRNFRNPVRLSPVQGRAALLALDLVSKAVDPGILDELRAKVLAAVGRNISQVEADKGAGDTEISETIDKARQDKRVLEILYPSAGEIRARPAALPPGPHPLGQADRRTLRGTPRARTQDRIRGYRSTRIRGQARSGALLPGGCPLDGG